MQPIIRALTVLLLLLPSLAAAKTAIPVAVADFDNVDTAGEDAERAAAHAARVAAFAEILRDGLPGIGFEVVRLTCPSPQCSPTTTSPEALLASARAAGARLLVYGGIDKMSTLIQWGMIQAIDMERDRLVLDRSISFRGDTDEAFRRAAAFVLRYLDELPLDP